jgi:hypothetical protein
MAIVSCHRDDAILNQSPNISEFKDEWDDLQREIDYYNTIIKWDEMWDIETAKKWFKKGHRLFLFKQENKIQGWMWVFTTKEFRHLYVNPQYRNVKNARDLISTAGYIVSKNWAKWWAHIDDWNLGAWWVARGIGWKKVIDFHDN